MEFQPSDIGALLLDNEVWKRSRGHPELRSFARERLPEIFDLLRARDVSGARKRWIEITAEARERLNIAFVDQNNELGAPSKIGHITEDIKRLAVNMFMKPGER